MYLSSVKVIDLLFQEKSQAIACYLIPHPDGVILVESGPGSTLPNLEKSLNDLGYDLRHITDVFLTHIHLDHAGASGFLASLDANIYVHPFGAKHLADPAKLINSAERIYGNRMEKLWGEILSVPQSKIRLISDGEIVKIRGNQIRCIFTPGHAEHHACYLFEGICFTGDIGGIRIPGNQYVRIPMPPPELDLDKWLASLEKIKRLKPNFIAPTHFGIYQDPVEHLEIAVETIYELKSWINIHLNKTTEVNVLKLEFNEWMIKQAKSENLTPEVIESFSLSNPLDMSVDGMIRYWTKVLHPEN